MASTVVDLFDHLRCRCGEPNVEDLNEDLANTLKNPDTPLIRLFRSTAGWKIESNAKDCIGLRISLSYRLRPTSFLFPALFQTKSCMSNTGQD